MAGHVERNGRIVIHMRYWWESQKETNYYEVHDVGGLILLK
jgi:hypothetical protein